MQVALGRRDTPVAHHALHLIDVEGADRLGSKGVAQIVKGNVRQSRALGRTDETTVKVAAADGLARPGRVLNTNASAAFPQNGRNVARSRRSSAPTVRAPALGAGVAPHPRIAVLDPHHAHIEINVADLQSANLAEPRSGLSRQREDRPIFRGARRGDQLAHLLGGVDTACPRFRSCWRSTAMRAPDSTGVSRTRLAPRADGG